ncbi:MAG: DUF5658 family protein [Acidimicrobiales bacterium]
MSSPRPAPLAHLQPRSVARLEAWQVCHSLLAWLIFLNIADLITTRLVLGRGGSESNPLMQGVIDSTMQASLVKFSCIVAVVALALRTRVPQRVAWSLGAVNVWYALVVGWNLGVLVRS